MDAPGASLIEGLDDAVVVTDAALIVVGWNAVMEQLTGVARHQAVGRPASIVLNFLRDADVPVHLQRALDGVRGSTGDVRFDSGGRTGWLEARFAPWRADGRVAGVVATLVDVTERRQRASFVRALEAIGHSLTSSLDLGEVLDSVVNRALEVMWADGALVVSWDGRARAFTVMRAGGRLSAEYVAGGTIPVAGGPISRAILGGTVITTSNILTDPATSLSPERRARIEQEGFKAVAAAPLRSNGRVHGAVVVHCWAERVFDAHDVAALRLVADHGALAIDNARLYSDATRRAERLRELAELEQLVAESLVVDDVLRRIAQAAARLLDAPVVQVWTADPEARVLHLSASSVEPGLPEVRMPRTVPFGAGNVGRTAETRSQVYVDNIADDPRSLAGAWARETGIVHLLAVPIVSNDDLLGVLSVRSRHGGISTAENRTLVTSFAARAAVAMEHARTYAEAVRRAGRLRDLVAVSHSITASLDSSDVMQRIARAAAALAPGALASVHVFEPETGMLRARGLSSGEWEGLPPDLAVNAGLPGLVVEARAPVLIPQPVSHPRTLARDWWRRRPTATYYGVPINVGETFVGVLDYVLPEGLPDAEEQEALRLLAAQAGIAIRNAGLYQEARRRRDVAESLARVARELTGTLEAERVAALVAQGVVELLGARGATLYRYEEGTGRLVTLETFGPNAEITRGLVLEPGEGAAGLAVAERKIVATPDVLREPRVTISPALRARLEHFNTGAVVSLPLVAQDHIVGALSLSDVRGREFSADELQALQVFADHAALALANARLYARAQDSVVRLRETQAQLVHAAKMSAVGQLVSGVAHELNNPLSVIIGYGQLLLARDVPAELRRPVELMVSQGERMSKIVRNLLYFARQRPPERAAVDIRQVMEQTLALRLNHLTLSKITVRTDFAEDVPVTTGDAQQLEQIFLNLLLNAEQAILEHKAQGEITLRTRLRADRAAIIAEVVDDGPGIPPESLPRIFEPFYTTKIVGAGTGLGLSVSYGIVQEHGGRLRVASRPGETIFAVELPVVTPPAPAPRAVARRVASGVGKVALVVEDEPAVLDLIVTLLGQRGWRVDVAPGGRAALDRLHRQRYDLVVSDMRMPEGDGEELYRSALRCDAGYARRFIFITGDTAGERAWTFLDGAAAPVVEKPFPPQAFEEAVACVVAAGHAP